LPRVKRYRVYDFRYPERQRRAKPREYHDYQVTKFRRFRHKRPYLLETETMDRPIVVVPGTKNGFVIDNEKEYKRIKLAHCRAKAKSDRRAYFAYLKTGRGKSARPSKKRFKRC
jgi:hypothetical protein